jgi:hypothetical protein
MLEFLVFFVPQKEEVDQNRNFQHSSTDKRSRVVGRLEIVEIADNPASQKV